MNTNGLLNSLVAQFNATGGGGPEKPKRKTTPKPKDAPAKDAKGAQTKGKSAGLRGTGNTITSVPQKVQGNSTANLLAISGQAGAQPIDRNTAAVTKKVVDIRRCLLQYNGTQMSPQDLKEKSQIDITQDSSMIDHLHRQQRIDYAGRPDRHTAPNVAVPQTPAAWYKYLPEHPYITNKARLLSFIRDNRGPALKKRTLSECYLKAADDLKALKTEGHIFIIGHIDTNPDKDNDYDTVHPCSLENTKPATQEVRDLWFECIEEHRTLHVPPGVQELQDAVERAGLRSAIGSQAIKRIAPGVRSAKERAKKPRAQRINISKATNAHLPGLFQGSQPKMLDQA